MKTLYEIKKELVEKPNNIWEDIFKELHNKFFGWGIKNVDYKLCCSSFFNNDFEAKYIKAWIYHVLKIPAEDPIWKDIFYLKVERSEVSYHGSGVDNYNFYVEFVLRRKIDQLKSTPGDWVYYNQKEVTEFMSKDNLIYNRLEEIRDSIFPTWGIE